MTMYFELYDVTGGKLLASNKAESEVLAVVRAFLTTGDSSYFTDLALVFTDEHGEKQLLAEGSDLAARALANTRITPVAV